MHDSRTYIDFVDEVLTQDSVILKEKDAAYGGSWKKRGGVNAYCMLARKIDRIEQRVRVGTDEQGDPIYMSIFQACLEDMKRGRAEGVLEDLADLSRYITLVRAEILSRTAQKA